MVWDLNRLELVGPLLGNGGHRFPCRGVLTVAINDVTGDIVVASGAHVYLFSVNGHCLAKLDSAAEVVGIGNAGGVGSGGGGVTAASALSAVYVGNTADIITGDIRLSAPVPPATHSVSSLGVGMMDERAAHSRPALVSIDHAEREYSKMLELLARSVGVVGGEGVTPTTTDAPNGDDGSLQGVSPESEAAEAVVEGEATRLDWGAPTGPPAQCPVGTGQHFDGQQPILESSICSVALLADSDCEFNDDGFMLAVGCANGSIIILGLGTNDFATTATMLPPLPSTDPNDTQDPSIGPSGASVTREVGETFNDGQTACTTPNSHATSGDDRPHIPTAECASCFLACDVHLWKKLFIRAELNWHSATVTALRLSREHGALFLYSGDAAGKTVYWEL